MNDLKRKLLLLLAQKPKGHRYFYSQYCKLIYEGLAGWVFGTAFLTDKGVEWLRDNVS